MKLQTLEEVENTIGGRPETGNRKVRMSFYLPVTEADHLKGFAESTDQSVSQIIRSLLRKHVYHQRQYT